MSKIKTRKHLCIVLYICLMIGIFAVNQPVFAETSGDYTYAKHADNQTCTITKYNGAGGNVTIPTILDGYRVTGIGVEAFVNCSSLSSITIPNSVITIGNYAFYNCSNLSSIIIGNSVTTISNSAFSHCENLSSITIPNSVTTIGSGAFNHCENLSSITIPNSVTTIDACAFYCCYKLSSITIPNSVTTIGESAFFSCTNLESVYFDDKPILGTDIFENISPTPACYSPTGESLSSISCQATTTSNITVNSINNGSIIPSTSSGMKNEIISLQMKPDEGYTVVPDSLEYNDGTDDVTINGTSFEMPEQGITISGEFELIPVPAVTSELAETNNHTLTWNWDDATGEGNYRYKLNEGEWTYTLSNSFTPTEDFADGIYTLYVQEINDNGDWSSSGSFAVTVNELSYTVGIGTLTGGSIIATSTTAKAGDMVNLTVTPDSGKQLKAGTLKYNDESYHDITGTSFTMPGANVIITAEFEEIPLLIYTVDATVTTGGMITVSTTSAKAGDIIYITITPEPGKQLKAGALKYNGMEITTGTTFTMPEAHVTVTAEFENVPPLTYTVNSAVTTEGIIIINPTTAKAGDTVNLTIIPNLGKQLKAGTLQYNGIAFTSGTSFIMPAENVVITAEFEDMPIVVIYKTLVNVTTPSDITGIINGTAKTASALGLPNKIMIETDAGSMTADVNWHVETCLYNPSLSTAQTFAINGTVTLPTGVINTNNVSLSVTISVSLNQKSNLNNGSSGSGGSSSSDSSSNNNSSSTNKTVIADPVVPSVPTPNQPQIPYFSDITIHWAKKDIEFAVSRGLLAGTGDKLFSPNTPMTRGMFITALGRLAKIDAGSQSASSFTDVKMGNFYTPYVEWAVENKIAAGKGNNQFMPDEAITREEMAVMMMNYAKVKGYNLPLNFTSTTFKDNKSISSWSENAVKSMQQAGILKGKKNNYFIPKDIATRAEASAVLHRFIELIIEANSSKA